MRVEDVIIAGGTQTIRVVADAEGVTLSNGAYWQQRLTRDEALRLADIQCRGLPDAAQEVHMAVAADVREALAHSIADERAVEFAKQVWRSDYRGCTREQRDEVAVAHERTLAQLQATVHDPAALERTVRRILTELFLHDEPNHWLRAFHDHDRRLLLFAPPVPDDRPLSGRGETTGRRLRRRAPGAEMR